MKNILLKYTLLFVLAVATVSCMEEDEKYATLTESPSIIVSVPEAALPVPPTGQPQLTQPNLNVVSGRFSRTGNLVMTITLPEGFSNLTISTLVTATGAKVEKGSFTGVNGSVDWTYPMSTLSATNTQPAANTSVVLLLTASDGSTVVSRVFTISVLA